MTRDWAAAAADNLNSALFAAGYICCVYGTMHAGWGWLGMFLIGASVFFFVLGHYGEIKGDVRRHREEADRWKSQGGGSVGF